MRILILGAAGQVGFELVRSLSGLGEIVAADRNYLTRLRQRSYRPRPTTAYRTVWTWPYAGNGAARFPALRGQHAEYTALQLKAYRDGSRSTDPQSMMRTIAGRLTDDDIEQLSRYVSALH